MIRPAPAMLLLCLLGGAGSLGAQPDAGAAGGEASERWYRGNLHTHTLWSDGDEFPELAVEWYRRNGYHFVSITDHNVVPGEIRWITVARAERKGASLARYRELMGEGWVEVRQPADSLEVRLRAMEEIAARFEEPGRFLLVAGEEISDTFERIPIHVNGANLVETIPPQGGRSIAEVLDNNVAAVREQGRTHQRLVLAQANHPNYEWALQAEHLEGLDGVDPAGPAFFEVYNGHFLVHNAGDSLHPSADRLWDLALAERLRRGGGLLYGVGTDDTHNYHMLERHGGAQPGRGWVVVRAESLGAEPLIRAMLAGDFYASSGVELDSIAVTGDRMVVVVRPAEGVRYVTQFIGTRRDAAAPDQIGTVLAEVEGTRAEYRFGGDELYVRARIVSSRIKENAAAPGEFETAWVQPVAVDAVEDRGSGGTRP